MKKIIAIIVLILIIIGGILVWSSYSNKPKGQPVSPAVCTQEAKQCPDGSFVGRSGPNCEFQACPTATQPQTNAGWKISTDKTTGISFQYPETLGTKYISTQEWPPKITIRDDLSYSCAVGTSTVESFPPIATSSATVNGRSYCITVFNEGAAGSIYKKYSYYTDYNGGIIYADFVLQYPQCANYPYPQMTECNNERTSFDLNSLIDQIVKSVNVN
ncbi:MAG: hypothetical protein PHU42_00440 [Patescibacteria group bacterium]|nr:hypothetical protein [Patescibacteria group bacterium]